ncbi:MAG TPA: tRNA preQ1(34) S-adenosylmethionine ribosyltransferase-isomerase QueA [Planctomycetaceae bacterium]|jgi:S-adenosylmethionine:tRNA ribosyltransferase-isomerase|nr:tRNA preQ1(34) S-adenosylmethionine ribosyltransferase-isomerase QueA [Planctomycetaceae bacterium]
MDDLAAYDYDLPAELIATEPLPRRDASRLLVVDRRTGSLEHRSIADLPEILRPGDRLALNDTRVVPARLFGTRKATGGKWEGLFLEVDSAGHWRLIGHSGGKLRSGETLSISPAHRPESSERLELTLLDCDAEGIWTACAPSGQTAVELLEQFGTVPLPPYLHRKLGAESDWERYQTTYAKTPGAVAAPTAGLHFTPELLERCEQRGIPRAFVTLHVGIGTFRPISVERLSEHAMHEEWCELSAAICEQLNQTRAAGGRVVAVGTTSVRTLETAYCNGSFAPWSGGTNLFIRPPYQFGGVDCLLTNFHLPRSTLLVLVSTLAGLELMQQAYAAAVSERYRFYSYGDAMLIL